MYPHPSIFGNFVHVSWFNWHPLTILSVFPLTHIVSLKVIVVTFGRSECMIWKTYASIVTMQHWTVDNYSCIVCKCYTEAMVLALVLNTWLIVCGRIKEAKEPNVKRRFIVYCNNLYQKHILKSPLQSLERATNCLHGIGNFILSDVMYILCSSKNSQSL